MSSSPFGTVTGDDHQTHLVVSSPAVPHTHPDQFPATTLCGRTVVTAESDTPAHLVECTHCLAQAPLFMGLPSWQRARTPHQPTPALTDRLLQLTTAFMPPLTGPEGVAERLLLHLHYGIDWGAGGWVAKHRITYWDRILPDRVITATYLNRTLRGWWSTVAEALDSRPRNATDRAELERLLRADSLPVLEVLRNETEPLLLRTRIVAEENKRAKAAS